MNGKDGGSFSYYDDDDVDETGGRSNKRPYYELEEEEEEDDYIYEESSYQKLDTLAWETLSTDAGTVHILLPPPAVRRPSTILHFVGGTFFGSAPQVWYRQLLQDLVQHTQAVVVATSIPVTLFEPLQHVTLARKLQRQFKAAWRQVLLEEYEPDILKNVPVCAMGHSLGSRLLVVLSTLGDDRETTATPSAYSAFVLMSFTNYGAAAGIPGVHQLGKSSRKLQDETRKQNRRRGREGWTYDDFDDDDDEDWGDLFGELQQGLRSQALRVKSALTPSASELEFFPSPEQLWRALNEGKRYRIPKTLIVQFDDDDIDQSVQISNAIKNVSSVKFARLRGAHLSPISVNGVSSNGGDQTKSISTRAGRLLEKLLLSGRRRLNPNDELLKDLRQSIARYITEVVTKEFN